MKPCKVCHQEFQPFTTTVTVCSIECAINLAAEREDKRYKDKTNKMRREHRLQDRGYQLKKAQESFNAYIRERDKDLPCISCGHSHNKLTAGHYKTVGAGGNALRFNEDNCHGQCWWNCNRNKSGNIIEYRIELIRRIGKKRVEVLEGAHGPLKLSIDQIIAIRVAYKLKLKTLKLEAA